MPLIAQSALICIVIAILATLLSALVSRQRTPRWLSLVDLVAILATVAAAILATAAFVTFE